MNAASSRILITDCENYKIEPEQHVFVEELKQYDFEIISTTLSRKGGKKLRDAFGKESLKDRQSGNAR